jgi:hypothetical protein
MMQCTHHMNIPTKLVSASVALLLVGCESYRDSVRSAGTSLGAIQTRDLRQADAYRKVLPAYLALPSKRIQIEPGAGATKIIIQAEASGTKQSMIDKIVTFAQTNYLGPISLRVLPEDEMGWSKPTIISGK